MHPDIVLAYFENVTSIEPGLWRVLCPFSIGAGHPCVVDNRSGEWRFECPEHTHDEIEANLGLVGRLTHDSSETPPADATKAPLNGRRNHFAERIVSATTLAKQPRPATLVPGWLPATGIALIYGEPKSGKSLCQLDLAASATIGVPWLGQHVNRIDRALYVAAEAPMIFGERYDAWCQAHRAEPMIDVLSDRLNLASTSDTGDLADFLRAEPYDLLVIDTFAACTVGIDENTTRDMGIVMRNLEVLAHYTLVSLTHHARKSGPVARGSSALLATVDTSILLTRQHNLVTLVADAQRRMAPGARAQAVIDGLILRAPMADEGIDAEAAADAIEHLQPGMTRVGWLRQIMKETGISESTANRRVSAAIDLGLVTADGERNRRAYYPRS